MKFQNILQLAASRKLMDGTVTSSVGKNNGMLAACTMILALNEGHRDPSFLKECWDYYKSAFSNFEERTELNAKIQYAVENPSDWNCSVAAKAYSRYIVEN